MTQISDYQITFLTFLQAHILLSQEISSEIYILLIQEMLLYRTGHNQTCQRSKKHSDGVRGYDPST